MKFAFKQIILILAFTTTIALSLWPNLHPEQAVLDRYYWQMDVLIHSGYYFALCLFILTLNLKPKPIFVCLGLFTFSVALEGLQLFSYQRGVGLMDIGSNLMGIGLALLIFTIYNNIFCHGYKTN